MVNFSLSLSYLTIYLIVVNLISFLMYAFDKLQSIRTTANISRVSEINLLLSSLIGGSVGSIFAMVLFRHKIKKISFIIKFVVIVLVQIAFVVKFKII